MYRPLLLLPLLAFAPRAFSGAQPPAGAPETQVAQKKAAEPAPALPAGFHHIKLNGHTFTLPVGFTIEQAAGPDLVPRPIVAAFDDKGRLYVCDSSGSNAPVAQQVKTKPHRIVRLEDTNGDGRYDTSTVFVANVMFPEGAMWREGSLYVAAPPNILKFTDTDGDGKADKEEIWFDGKTLTGCANDLHGPYPGPDGWIYWCKGAFAKQEYTLPNGKPFTTRAAHIFRARPDGSKIEPVMTGGMDNPVDVVFTPGGERIFSTTFFQHPGNGKRDGLVHAIYGGVYGKDHDPVYEHPWTSPQFMPVLTHLGPAAPCGLHRYESDQFGDSYKNNIFCCQFNLRKVSRHGLVPSGSTFTTTDSDFVVSDSLDFHPTDVTEDADGSLLIVDTGGWYKLCCPTSQLVKPDVTGAIYRVKKRDAHEVDDPWGLKIDWANEQLADLPHLLDDPRPVVRQRAARTMVGRGDRGIKSLARIVNVSAYSSEAWRLAVATLAGVDHSEARLAARHSLSEYAEGDYALIGIHAVGLWRDHLATPDLLVLLRKGEPARQRAVAEALGRIGDPKTVPAILEALASDRNDRTLDHSLTYALIEIAAPIETAEGLKSPSPRVRRAAMTALDQIPGGKLDPKVVLAELEAKDAALRETAWWIAGKHPQWGDALAGYFRKRLTAAATLAPAARIELTDRLLAFAKNPAIQQVIATGVEDAGSRPLALQVMARSGLKALPANWKHALPAALSAKDDSSVRDGFAVLRAIPTTEGDFGEIITAAKLARGNERTWSPAESLALLAAAPPGTATPTPADFAIALRGVGRDEPPATRALAADALARAKLTSEQLVSLTGCLRAANPLDVAKLLGAFAKSSDEKVGFALVAALSEPGVRAVIRTEQVNPILDKYPKPVRDAAETLYAQLAEARKDERAKLERLEKSLPTGDIRRGQLVFNAAKTQCVACHKIGYVGGVVGPDLTRIGSIRTERDLLESIVFPSASFVRSYEPVRVTTTDGRVFNGILKKDAADEIILVVGADKEERVARADVESITPGTVSIMPAGLDQQLSAQELADLVAFLKACR